MHLSVLQISSHYNKYLYIKEYTKSIVAKKDRFVHLYVYSVSVIAYISLQISTDLKVPADSVADMSCFPVVNSMSN